MGSVADREIPYNYTSADDRRILAWVLGPEVLKPLERLAFTRRTGRSWRILMRFVGDLFIHCRNAFLYQELIDDRDRRRDFLAAARRDLSRIGDRGDASPDLRMVLDRCRRRLEAFGDELSGVSRQRHRIRQRLGAIVGDRNVFFDPFVLMAHATDATNWRLHMPVAVVRPDEERQAPLLLEAISGLGLKAVPRGGGTGLTGGAVPAAHGCVVINTEKLDHVGGVFFEEIVGPDGRVREIPAIELGAGVITEAAMTAAAEAGLVFATDPTSAWACTIGGNIAENAGGKRAVLWGTAIDNLLRFRMAMPGGRMVEIRRSQPTGRRIAPGESVSFSVVDAATGESLRRIDIPGHRLRKPGLGKDITNKALEGLPGVQKEGTDGIITSAVFLLHESYPHQRTACLEFFGEDMDEAGRVIVEISRAFVDRGGEALMALEHFDEEYVQAIDYKAKAPRRQRPKAVLLIDIVGHAEEQVNAGLARLTALLAAYPNTFMAVAAGEEEAVRFWRDRKRLGAIAARTNAFKLNEDIVLPLEALAEFSEFVDDLNMEEERDNQVEVIWHLLNYLEKATPIEDPEWLAAKLPRARELLQETLDRIYLAGRKHLRAGTHLLRATASMASLLSGFSKVKAEIERDVAGIRSRRIVVATHMHAGDGNVHVNIPVFANDREMMRHAAEVADIVMEKAVALEGVVSGEHGIGFTKIKHLPPDIMADFQAYQAAADPGDLVNPRKLTDPSVADQVFTPSFNLIELEARILRYGHLEKLAEKISRCVRCGKCKTGCCVFYPAENLFFHPRNKNLALTAIIEALLYDTQRSHAVGLRPLKWLGEVADHCTLCHKCKPPCPVDIDTAEVSILERELLADRGGKRTALPTKVVLGYLDTRSEAANRLARRMLFQWGGAVQRTGARVFGPLLRRPGAPTLLAPFYAPAPAIAPRPLAADWPAHDLHHALLVAPRGHAAATVFYYPGCGSERLHADIALASIYLLLKTGVNVLLPPKHLCCGFPARANAKADLGRRQTLRNTIVFNQIRTMVGHIGFDACLVSCGTCREALSEADIPRIFDAPLTDIAGYVLARGIDARLPGRWAYHAPCHDSLDGRGAGMLEQIAPEGVTSLPHCCSEAGTLALSRPDIAAAMLARKKSALQAFKSHTGGPFRVVTNCPACLNGLGRQGGLRPAHLTVALTDSLDIRGWRAEVAGRLACAERIRF